MTFGFIILRHVICENTNKYWIECYTCIRRFYPTNKILIVDDHSNYDFITDIMVENTLTVNSEYKGRGELLPYLYYLNFPLFDKAVILHDSVFIQTYIHFDNNMENTPLWCFEHHWNNSVPEKNIISLLKPYYPDSAHSSNTNGENNTHLQELYDNKELWKGCFGAMTFISYDFLKDINAKYNLYNIINYMQSRFDRTFIERILPVIITYEKYEIQSRNAKNVEDGETYKNNPLTTSIFGNIHDYCKWEYTYTDYISDKMNNNIHLPIIKIWSGR